MKPHIVRTIAPLTVYKGCKDDTVVELELPIGTLINTCVLHDGWTRGTKLRANQAVVKRITANYGKGKKLQETVSWWDSKFKYKVGETVTPKRKFSENTEVCQSGIHFYLTKKEVVESL